MEMGTEMGESLEVVQSEGVVTVGVKAGAAMEQFVQLFAGPV